MITILFQGQSNLVPISEIEAKHFINGEVPPAIAERFVPLGMPRRGLVCYAMRVEESGVVRVVGPSLCRRAGTMSSARP